MGRSAEPRRACAPLSAPAWHRRSDGRAPAVAHCRRASYRLLDRDALANCWLSGALLQILNGAIPNDLLGRATAQSGGYAGGSFSCDAPGRSQRDSGVCAEGNGPCRTDRRAREGAKAIIQDAVKAGYEVQLGVESESALLDATFFFGASLLQSDPPSPEPSRSPACKATGRR